MNFPLHLQCILCKQTLSPNNPEGRWWVPATEFQTGVNYLAMTACCLLTSSYIRVRFDPLHSHYLFQLLSSSFHFPGLPMLGGCFKQITRDIFCSVYATCGNLQRTVPNSAISVDFPFVGFFSEGRFFCMLLWKTNITFPVGK